MPVTCQYHLPTFTQDAGGPRMARGAAGNLPSQDGESIPRVNPRDSGLDGSRPAWWASFLAWADDSRLEPVDGRTALACHGDAGNAKDRSNRGLSRQVGGCACQ